MFKPDRRYVLRDLDHPGDSIEFLSTEAPNSETVRLRMFTVAHVKDWERPRLFEIVDGKEVER